ncbi:MAG: zinc dependent phospholipase C family protein [Candidatus Cloacimonetes bacterium]|nr:zinc dependent phospholipase C family protein [Candidatus Cloacimonadota bacterium]
MWIWDSRTHQFIVSEALKKCKSSFTNLLELHQGMFILGIEAPDRIFKDFTNHYYNCTPNRYGVNPGSVIKKIDKEIKLINSMLNEPEKIIVHHNIAPFLKSLLDTSLKAFIFELGVLSHYIVDLHQPLHTDGKERFTDEETVHKILEADTRLHLNDFNIHMRRRKRIKNPLSYFEERIYEINEYYDAIIERYFLRKGKVKPDRWENTFFIVEECLTKATQNVANVFLSFEDASKILKLQVHHARMLKKIRGSIRKKKYYKIIKYPSGTVSVRVKK